MSNTFIYEQGWLVEKPGIEKPPCWEFPGEDATDCPLCKNYREYLTSLRRFKYDYTDPGKEMELGKDFEVKRRMLSYKETVSDGILTSSKTEIIYVAIPITQRTYSEQDEKIKVDKEVLLDALNDIYNHKKHTTFETAFRTVRAIAKTAINKIKNLP